MSTKQKRKTSKQKLRSIPIFDHGASGDTHDWAGEWVPPPNGKIKFDWLVVAHVNRCLKQICIPTWIKQAIPVLGKALFGRLKRQINGWANLFTIQLPLILPVIWNVGSESLLHNLSHLVSLVYIYIYISHIQSHWFIYPSSEVIVVNYIYIHLIQAPLFLGISDNGWA
ncbi:uncharacterized protein VP01_3649g2 [Puccinia sorghi]|uniref:Uncharacterized protein n=1 Tax=Puccinia sorghi TaxID=27349 RepID=A0A0L6UUP1_9BASI|nr:uncharacterized protein VP01_3649g2 [Puccinia sorghi]